MYVYLLEVLESLAWMVLHQSMKNKEEEEMLGLNMI